MIDDGLSGSVFVNQLGGGFGADAPDAGDVVDRVAGEGLDLQRLFGRPAFLLDQVLVCDQFVLARVEHGGRRAEKLLEVFVLADHVNMQIRPTFSDGDAMSQSGDDVVGLEARQPQDRHADRFEDRDDAFGLDG